MSNEVVKSESGEVTEALETPVSRDNLFRVLVPDALHVVRRAMLNGKDQKLAVSTAQDVLDRAGETKKNDVRESAPVHISDSNVQFLLQVLKESE